jgi:hypothetical protein
MAPEVDIYHVRIDTCNIATLPPMVVTHMKLAYYHAMASDHVETWCWKTRYTDPTGIILPDDTFATFVMAKTSKGSVRD